MSPVDKVFSSPVSFWNTKLKNRLVVASGTGGFGEELETPDIYGVFTTKTLTLASRKGNQQPRSLEGVGFMLNSIGLENPGLDEFFKSYLPKLPELPILVSIYPKNEDEVKDFLEANWDSLKQLLGIEINFSCPNLGLTPRDDKKNQALLKGIVGTFKKNSKIRFLVKLAPLGALGEMIQIAEGEGADGLTLFNTLPALMPYRENEKLLFKESGLSGPPLAPVYQRLVMEARTITDLPIIASGGVYSSLDVQMYLHCGADLVSLGTSLFKTGIGRPLGIEGPSPA